VGDGDGLVVGFDDLVGVGVGFDVWLTGGEDCGVPYVGCGATGTVPPDCDPDPDVSDGVLLGVAVCEGLGLLDCVEPIGSPRPPAGDTAPVGPPPWVRVIVLSGPEVSAFPAMIATATAATPPPAHASAALLRRPARRLEPPRPARWNGPVIARSGSVRMPD
jgi:hypothetical protein